MDGRRDPQAGGADERSRREALLSVLAHELRTPLNAIAIWARLLQSGVDAAAVRRGADAIARHAEAQARLLSDLLDGARLAAGSLAWERRPLAFAEAVREEVEAAAEEGRAKGVHVEAGPLAAVEVSGDRERLKRVVGHLLGNALEFTPPGGSVRVRLEREGPAVLRLTVTDDGAGFDPAAPPAQDLEQLLSEPRRLPRQCGGGIGLVVARRLAEMHGGGVEAHSEGLGQGSTFTLRLPAEPGP